MRYNAELPQGRGTATMSITPGFFHKKKRINTINRTFQVSKILPTSIAYTQKLEIFVVTLRYPHISKHKVMVVAQALGYFIFFFSIFFIFIFFSLVLTYREGVDMLREAGVEMNYDEDLR